MDDRATIEKMYREYWRCMIGKDIDELKRLMAEEYTLTHMTGVRQTRDVFLRGLADGTFNYYSAEHDLVRAEVQGDRAVLTGKSRVTAAVYGGGKTAWRLRGDFTLKKGNGVWLFTGSVASTY